MIAPEASGWTESIAANGQSPLLPLPTADLPLVDPPPKGAIVDPPATESSKQSPLHSKYTKYILNLDFLSYRIIGLGFPFLTIGILSGAVWANEAWGSYWSWDPKETWALLTWLIFAIYLHTRLTKGWQGEKPAIIASLGFLVVWFCYLGVNLIGEGLHSYGFFKL
jgi:cytochrome c-type biogenesis protein CcsB